MRVFVNSTSKMELHAFGTTAAMAAAAASDFSRNVALAIAARGEANVMVATGNSQFAFYEALYAEKIDWANVRCFHIDEYVGVDASHPASFVRYLQERLVAHLHPREFHGLTGDAPNAHAEAARYAALLAAHPLDVCVLGIGENGHLGFNDPPPLGGADFGDSKLVKVVTLDEACRLQQVGEGHFVNLAAVPTEALTATIPCMLGAVRVIAVVPELRKAAIVARSLTDTVSEACPASILRTRANVAMYLDADSASRFAAFK